MCMFKHITYHIFASGPWVLSSVLSLYEIMFHVLFFNQGSLNLV